MRSDNKHPENFFADPASDGKAGVKSKNLLSDGGAAVSLKYEK